MTPFSAGRAAYQAGKTQDDNPHDPNGKYSEENWPGPYKNWEAGYINAKATAEHTERMKA